MAMLVITRGYIFIAYASYIHNVFDAFPWKVWGIWRIIALPALSAFAMVQAFFAAAASARLPKVAVPQVRLCCLGSGSLAHSNMTNPQKHASYNIYIYIIFHPVYLSEQNCRHYRNFTECTLQYLGICLIWNYCILLFPCSLCLVHWVLYNPIISQQTLGIETKNNQTSLQAYNITGNNMK